MRRMLEGTRTTADEGTALVFVVGTMLVLAMLAMTALAYVMNSTQFARYDQDHSGAIAAAQAGVDDFISHLNRDDTYWNPSDLDCGNRALQGPMTTGNPCSWTASTPLTWKYVSADATGAKDPAFHYSFDPTNADAYGTIVVTSTGRVNGQYRTVQATVVKHSPADYVYYTDFESADPSNKQAYSSTPGADCGGNGYANAKYWWQGRSGCQEITFVSGDRVDGPVFSNDSILSAGATFTSGLQTDDPACKNASLSNVTSWNNCVRNTRGDTSTANFNGVMPTYQNPLYLADNSAEYVTDPGCHYFGSTRIVFNANGTMTVWDNSANGGGRAPVAIAKDGGTPPSCGSYPALGSAAGATVPVPTGMVVYVAGDTTGLARKQCDAGQIGGPSGTDTLPLGTFTQAKAAAKPASATDYYTYDLTMAETNKYCQEGNVYVEGVVNGRVSVGAEQSVVVTGDLVLAHGLNSPLDVLGLVATNSVEVFHPWIQRVTPVSGTCPGLTCKWNATPTNDPVVTTWPHKYADPTGGVASFTGIEIMGSIQTLQHSFYVQQYKNGPQLGTLQVNGSISQRWRGIVGQSNTTGYLKNYVYNSRLLNAPPPYFPKWKTSQWSQRYFGEISTPANLRH